MFTGIVEELGEVVRREPDRLTVRGRLVTADARPGDSIAVDGVCLTVVTVADGAFTADVMAETWARTALGRLAAGDPVNLERAATATSRLGGHLVQGHVDGVGTIRARTPGQRWHDLRVALPAEQLSRYLVEKGSVTVDGVSLTVTGVGADWFEVSLVPTTLELTTLGRKQVGDPVNLEVDVIAKYVEKLVTAVQP
ncbi:MAG: riboflavin synthase [Micromonosporaceae bacterium]|nr:riboflavin synthase [Micromonosporaceae bacterium]